MLHLLSFAATSAPALLRHWLWRPDVVWMPAPAFACAPATLAFARSCGAKAWIHVQDFEVDIAFETGLLKGEGPKRWVKGLERFILKRFDRVSTISSAMMARAKGDKGIAEERLFSLPNWVDVNVITPFTGASPYREELGIPDDAVVALYSGSMGPKHGVELLAEAAQRLREDGERLYFVFCGEGAGKSKLEAMCSEMPNVRLLPLQPMERLSDLLGMADIHLLPQRPSAGDLVMPSKLTGMLSSGRPVVATALPNTELDHVVRTCGIVVPPGDAEALAGAVQRLLNDPEWRAQLGRMARRYAEKHLAADAVLDRFEKELRVLVGKEALGAALGAEPVKEAQGAKTL